MKIKDLFKMVENANNIEIRTGANRERYAISVEIDGLPVLTATESIFFLTYKGFKKAMKEEWQEYIWDFINDEMEEGDRADMFRIDVELPFFILHAKIQIERIY